MKDSFYESLYSRFVQEIRTGRLKAGSRMPSVRRCAEDLGVSRNTVVGAYNLLLSEGYIYSKERSGYFVADFESLPPIVSSGYHPNAKHAIKDRERNKGDNLIDLSANLVDSTLFPYSTLRRLYRETLTGPNNSILVNAGMNMGDEDLRASIAEYVFREKGISCESSQVVIGNGTSFHLQMIALLFNQMYGRRALVLMENPGFEGARGILEDAGCEIRSVNLDQEGATIGEIRVMTEGVLGPILLHISPSHQFPMGVTMSAPRRAAVLDWASSGENRFIIEDDYDSDFRYNGHPIAPICSMDSRGKVIYIGTFSRTLTPSIRLSYMILPPNLLMSYEEKFSRYPCPVSRIDQKVVSLFIDQGFFERHINRMRRIYKNRRNMMVQIIKEAYPSADILGDVAGLHFIMKSPIEELAMIERARQAGFKIQGTGTGYLVIGYAHLSEEQMKRFGTFLKDVQ